MTTISAYLTFRGNCREAMRFYQASLGGELELQPIKGSPIQAQCPTAMHDEILHATLMKDGLILMGSDMIGPDGFAPGNNIALSVNCSSEEEIQVFFDRLSAEGRIIHPLRKEFWGATFGVLTDRFGIRWMLTYDSTLQDTGSEAR